MAETEVYNGEDYDRIREDNPHYREVEDDISRLMMRTFETGATRDTDKDKYNYEGFLSSIVVKRYAKFMHKNRLQKDDSLREADNWQAGFTRQSFIDSGWRHFMDWWLHHDGFGEQAEEELEDALCALIFNAMGRLHEELLGRDVSE